MYMVVPKLTYLSVYENGGRFEMVGISLWNHLVHVSLPYSNKRPRQVTATRTTEMNNIDAQIIICGVVKGNDLTSN